jgi:hypothetical protein
LSFSAEVAADLAADVALVREQALLEVGSIKQRLLRLICGLIEQRNSLQLVLALVRLENDGGKDIPVD